MQQYDYKLILTNTAYEDNLFLGYIHSRLYYSTLKDLRLHFPSPFLEAILHDCPGIVLSLDIVYQPVVLGKPHKGNKHR